MAEQGPGPAAPAPGAQPVKRYRRVELEEEEEKEKALLLEDDDEE